MKRKIINPICLATSLICLSLSIFCNIKYSEFNSTTVKENIASFSSNTYGGRLPGSNENSLVAEVIRNDFKKNGLTPLNEDFKEDFNIICPIKTNTNPYINISLGDTIIDELQYGIDFKEDMLNFKINSLDFSKEDTVNISTSSIEVKTPNGNCLFYVSPKNDFSFRSSFISDFPYDMVIMINTNTYNKILDSVRNGYVVSVHVPFTTEEKTISNIVGVIEGKNDTAPPLVLTAHYDHLGSDALGNTYSGALDNASGTSFLLELQRSLATYGKPKRDIIFVALNAEEFGLLGSKEFATQNINTIKNSEVINFDMIGSNNHPITLMQGESFKEKDSPLLDSIVDICKDYSTTIEVIHQDSSDHASFNNLGIDSLTFCHSDMSRIHTPEDKVEYINLNAIDTVYSIIDEKIKKSSYGFIINFFYSKSSVLVFSLISGLYVGIIFSKKKSL